jgi:hypothetical protein
VGTLPFSFNILTMGRYFSCFLKIRMLPTPKQIVICRSPITAQPAIKFIACSAFAVFAYAEFN